MKSRELISSIRFCQEEVVRHGSLNIETTRRKGTVKGRESRNQTLNTKLTPTEAAAVEAASEADGKRLENGCATWRCESLAETTDNCRLLPSWARSPQCACC